MLQELRPMLMAVQSNHEATVYEALQHIGVDVVGVGGAASEVVVPRSQSHLAPSNLLSYGSRRTGYTIRVKSPSTIEQIVVAAA
jgi:hypothetical protein